MDDMGNRLALRGVLVMAGMFVLALLALGNVLGWMLGSERRLAI